MSTSSDSSNKPKHHDVDNQGKKDKYAASFFKLQGQKYFLRQYLLERQMEFNRNFEEKAYLETIVRNQNEDFERGQILERIEILEVQKLNIQKDMKEKSKALLNDEKFYLETVLREQRVFLRTRPILVRDLNYRINGLEMALEQLDGHSGKEWASKEAEKLEKDMTEDMIRVTDGKKVILVEDLRPKHMADHGPCRGGNPSPGPVFASNGFPTLWWAK